MARLLVCGVYLADQENWAASEIAEIGSSLEHDVEQRWIALDVAGTGKCDLPNTVAVVLQRTPKFVLINRLLGGVGDFDYLVVVDDDVRLPPRFIDAYLAHIAYFQFALAQPALTPDSYLGHRITAQMPGLSARRTRFVEIGPVLSIHRGAFDCLLPFDESLPMGWGLDLVWPQHIEEKGLRMGIVDSTPVDHGLRNIAAHYSGDATWVEMEAMLQARPHLSFMEAFTVIEAYA